MDGISGDRYCVVIGKKFGVISDRAESTHITYYFCGSEGSNFQKEFSPVDFLSRSLVGHGVRVFEQC